MSEAAVLDTETTGLLHDPRVRVIEVAVVGYASGDTIYQDLVSPTLPGEQKYHIPDHLTREVHGISDEMVAGAPGWEEVRARLDRALRGRIVWAYNAPFDQGVILVHEASWRRATGARGVLRIPGFRDIMKYQAPPGKWLKLAEAAPLAGHPYPRDVRHRALADALAARAVLLSRGWRE